MCAFYELIYGDWNMYKLNDRKHSNKTSLLGKPVLPMKSYINIYFL